MLHKRASSITEWDMHITAQGPRVWNDLYCVEWDVKLYYTIPYHLPLPGLPGLEPVGGEPLMSVTRDQWARPMVIFPAARYHRPLAGTKLYCLVTEARVLTTCPGFHSTAERLGFEFSIYWSQVRHPNHSATEPHSEMVVTRVEIAVIKCWF